MLPIAASQQFDDYMDDAYSRAAPFIAANLRHLAQ